MADHYPEQTWLSCVLSQEEAISVKQFQVNTNLFGKRSSLVNDDETTAIYLNVNPHFKSLFVDEIATIYNIPDLCGTLGDCFSQLSYTDQSGRR